MLRRQNTKRRRWFQFSLRSVLLLTLIASIVLAIYRPDPPGGRPLADGWTIYDQTEKEILAAIGPGGSIDHLEVEERHGRFIVRDAEGRKRVDGFFADGEPASLWRVYHPNGRKAMEGQCSEGVPSGKWMAWYPNRVKAAELSFQEPDVLESQIGGRQLKQPIAMTRREGLAAFGSIHGETAEAGEYRDDRREGTWTAGSEKVDYLAGLQHGSQAGRFLGHQIDDWPAFLKQLEADLSSADAQRQLDAGKMLRHCGDDGVAIVRRHLPSGDRDLKLLLCETIGRIGPDAIAAELELEPLAADEDQDIAIAALLALSAIGSDRDACIKRLLEIAASTENQQLQKIVLGLSELNVSVVPALKRFINDEDQGLHRCAFQSLVAMLSDALGSRSPDRFERIAAVLSALNQATQHSNEAISEAATEVLQLYDDGRLPVRSRDSIDRSIGQTLIPVVGSVGPPF
jgi:hypothetical protein